MLLHFKKTSLNQRPHPKSIYISFKQAQILDPLILMPCVLRSVFEGQAFSSHNICTVQPASDCIYILLF